MGACVVGFEHFYVQTCKRVFLFLKKFKYGNFEYGLFPAFTMRITLVLLVLCEAGCQRECVNRGSE